MGPINSPLPSTFICDDAMLSYCQNLSTVLSEVSQTVKAALTPPAGTPLHSLKPGDWVVVKELRKKHWKSKCWHLVRSRCYWLLTQMLKLQREQPGSMPATVRECQNQWTNSTQTSAGPGGQKHKSAVLHRCVKFW